MATPNGVNGLDRYGRPRSSAHGAGRRSAATSVAVPDHLAAVQRLPRLAHPSLAPRTGRRMGLGVVDGAAGDLHPARLRIVFLRIAAAEHFERAVGMALEVDVGLA